MWAMRTGKLRRRAVMWPTGEEGEGQKRDPGSSRRSRLHFPRWHHRGSQQGPHSRQAPLSSPARSDQAVVLVASLDGVAMPLEAAWIGTGGPKVIAESPGLSSKGWGVGAEEGLGAEVEVAQPGSLTLVTLVSVLRGTRRRQPWFTAWTR